MAGNAATPTIAHRQKLFGLFPDWRLKSAVKDTSLEALEASAEACEWWGWRGAMVLTIGLIAGVILTIWDLPHESMWGRWGGVFGTTLVAIGVGLEVQFHRMASRRTDELALRAKWILAAAVGEVARLQMRVAETKERATKAELELAKIRLPGSPDAASEARARLAP